MGALRDGEPVDRDLVEQAQAGDREAFAVLARASADRMFAIAQRILRDVGRAEDAVQQTLVIAWRELPRLRDPDRFDAWLHRLLVHACYAEAREARRWTTVLQILPTDMPTARDEMLSVADRDELDRGFRRLPADQRAVLVLRHYLGLSPQEIAELLGVPEGTARSRLHYAHRAMRAALEAAERPAQAIGGHSS
jgi:RNA polymerase sigma-70 factor (ECF subfamily)